MSKPKHRVVLTAAVLACVGLGVRTFLFPGSVRGDDPLPPLNGLPMPFKLISVTPLVNGQTQVIYRSAPFVVTLTNDVRLMHDQGYLGQMGTWGQGEGTRIWLNVPDGKVISIFPDHLPAGTPFAVPSFWPDVSAFHDAHPDVTIVEQGQYVYQRESDGSLSYQGHGQKFPPPLDFTCDFSAIDHPFYIEYHATIGGDLPGVTFPATAMHYFYIVPDPY